MHCFVAWPVFTISAKHFDESTDTLYFYQEKLFPDNCVCLPMEEVLEKCWLIFYSFHGTFKISWRGPALHFP